MADSGAAWVCLVCGYVHRGPEPPENCPVCGSPSSQFEPYTEPVAPVRPAPQQWRCLICSHQHAGSKPDAPCPVCGASPDEFEPAEEAAAARATSGAVKVVIAGAGIAGLSAAESVRQASPEAEIMLVTKESELPYYRLNLTRYLAGEIGRDDLPVHPLSWYDEQRIQLFQDCEISGFSAVERHVEFANGARESFEKLILTCGAHPFIPPFPGASLDGVRPLRTIEDADRLIEASKRGVSCVVIGGGILGLETAGGLARRGATVTVLEGYEWLLPRQLDREAGAVLARYVANLGITVRYQAKTSEIVGDGRARGVLLADGAQLPADLVVVTTGIRSNSHLARTAGLAVNQGVVVDACLATSHPDVFAAGDIAEHNGVVYGLWEPARFQGAIAGQNAAGLNVEFGGLPRANALKVLGVDLFSVGTIMPEDGSYDLIREEADGQYYRFLFHDGHLAGAILIGDTRLSALATRAVKTGTDCSGLLRKHPGVKDVLDFLEGAFA